MKLVCFMKEWLMIWNLILPFYENMSVLIWPVWHSHVFWNKFFGVLIHFWTFLFPPFRFSTFTTQLSGFWGKIISSCSSGNYIDIIFLFYMVQSGQVKWSHFSEAGKACVGCHTSVALWKMKDCWLVCKALYFGFLVFFYFAFGKDR